MMCCVTDAARRVLGIRPYAWKPTRLPFDHSALKGQRGLNGAASWSTYGLTPREAQMMAEIERAHRQIRQIAADLKLRRPEHD